MKKSFLTGLATLFVHMFLAAQSDTSYLYFSKDWKNCSKDTAFYYAKIYKAGNVWERKDYWVAGNRLQMEGSYLKKDSKTQQGLFKWYKENGDVDKSTLYEKGHTKNITVYYPNGNKKAMAAYSDDRQTEVKGWDENGKEIPDFIFEREARFPGGLEGWRRYLEQNLNSNVAADANAPSGMYTVKVQFIVTKEGDISDVKTISVPDKCGPCALEAVRVISNGPKWEPAIQYNKPVIYQAIQHVSFQVAEDKKS